MNKLRYRIVFNKARGMCMAVAETARSQGKGGAQGAGGPADGMAPATLRLPPLRRLVVLLGIGLGSLSLDSVVFAQVVADRTAPGQQRPTVLTTANGVIQVNVQTPSAAGVSRNTYSQFDVPQGGVILNNSRTNTQSQLGGWVVGNPWMTQGTAKVILNEVNSNNPSRLQGYIEVAGDRAETVIANPAGIVVSGGGFINVSRATLTTGAPRLEDGKLTGYAVQRGQIVIDGTGLDASKTDYTALISRAIQVNAGIWAQRLDVIAGVNDVTVGADGPAVQARQVSDVAPLYAIDVAKLGGMYANQIYLVGTEAGVGVRNAGNIGAAAGDLVVTASGRLENSGTLSASQSLKAQAAALDNSGVVQAMGALALHADSLRNSGEVQSAAQTLLTIRDEIDNSGGAIEAPRIELTSASLHNAGGSITQTGASALNIDADQVVNAGGTLGRQAVQGASDAGSGTVTAQPIDIAGTGSASATGAVPADGATSVSADKGTAAPQPVLPDGMLKTGLADNTGGVITANGDMTLHAAAFDNRGGHTNLNSFSVAGTAFDNSRGTLAILRGLTVHTDSFVNDQGKLLVGAGFDASVGQFSNRQGLLQAGQLTAEVTGAMDNSGGTLRQLGGTDAVMKVGGELGMEQGTLDVAAGLRLTAGSIGGSGSGVNVGANLAVDSGATSTVRGKWVAGGAATFHTGAFDNGGGTISSAGPLAVSAGALANAGGTLATGTDAAITAAGNVDNTGGIIQASGNLQLTATGAIGNHGGAIETLSSHSGLTMSGSAIASDGRIVNAGDGNTAISAVTLNNGGQLGGNGDVAIGAATLTNGTGARIHAVGAMDLQVTAALSNAGDIGAGGSLRMEQASARLDNHGSMSAHGPIEIDAAAVDNGQGTIATAAGSNNMIVLNAGDLSNRGGTIQADAGASVGVRGALDNAAGHIAAGGDLKLVAGGHIDNSNGAIDTAGRLGLHGGEISNHGGTITAAGNAASSIEADRTIDNGGLIGANGAFTVTAQTLNNGAGTVSAIGNLDLALHDLLSNKGGAISSGGTLTFDQAGAALVNAGAITAAGETRLRLDWIDNSGGSISTQQGARLTLAANTLDNRGGQMIAGANLSLDVTGEVDNAAGVLQAAGSLDARSVGAFGNQSGVIEALGAHGTLALSAAALDNTSGRIVNTGDGNTSLSVLGHIETNGQIAGNGRLEVSAATMHNAGTVSAVDRIELGVGKALDNAGTISAGAELHADQLDASLRNSGTIVAGDTLALTLGSLDNGGRLATAQGSNADVLLRAQSIGNRGGSIMADRNFDVAAQGGIDNRGGLLQAKAQLQLDAGGQLDTSAGDIETLSADSTLQLHAGLVVSAGGHIVNAGSGDTSVHADAGLTNSGQIAASGALSVEARAITNQADGSITSGGALALRAHASLDNAGSIASRATLDMDEASASLANHGSIVANGEVAIRAGAIDNAGGTLATASGSGANLSVQGASLSNRGGQVVAEHALTLVIDGALDNSGGMLHGVETVQLASGATLANDGGVIEAVGVDATLALQANAIHNGNGHITNVGNGATTLIAATGLESRGLVGGNGRLDVHAATLDNETGAMLASGAAMALDIGARMNNAGTVSSGATLDVAAAGAMLGNAGTVVAQGPLTLQAGAFGNDGGQLATAKGSGADLRIDAASISNRGGAIQADRDTQLSSGADLENAGGTLQAGGSLRLDAAGRVGNNGGAIEALNAGATLALRAGTVDNGSGRIVNVGTGATSITTDGSLSSAGLVAGNGRLDLDVTDLDNQLGSSISAGTALAITASGGIANAGAIGSHDALALDAAKSVRNSGQIVGASVTVDTAAFDNGGGQLASAQGGAGAITVHAGSVANADGAIVADGSARVSADGAVDNRSGTLHANGALAVNAGGALGNQGGVIEVAGARATLDVHAASIDNRNGRLTNVGSGATHVVAAGDIFNSGTLAGNGALDVSAATLRNAAGGTLSAGAALDLHAGQAFENVGTTSAAGTLTLDEAGARITNSGQIAAGGALVLRGASIDNDGGQIATRAGADLVLGSASMLSNRTGSIAAAGNAALQAAGGYDNSHGQVQAQGRLQVNASGALVNNGGALEAVGAASTLALRAASIDNTAGRIVNAGSGPTSVDSASSIVNSGTLAANGALDISGLSLENQAGGTIGAVGALDLALRQQMTNAGGSISAGGSLRFDQAAASFANSGRIGAGGGVDIHAASITNDGGQLYTVDGSGAAIALQTGAMSNVGGTVAADGLLQDSVSGALANDRGTLHGGHGASIDVGAALANGSGTIETADGTLDITAQSIASSGRIANAGVGATIMTSQSSIVNSGSIAGNGTLDVHAVTLQNQSGGQVASGGAMLLDVHQQLGNAGTISSGGTLRFEQAGASFSNSGQIAAAGDAIFSAASFNNDGGHIATVAGSGAAIRVTAPALSNRGGAIVADGDATMSFSAGADNSQGTLHAGHDLTLNSAGAVSNAGGVIEATGGASALGVDGASIDNGNGRIANMGSGDTRLSSQTSIVNGGNVEAGGNLVLSGQTLQNSVGATIASDRDMTLAVTQQLANQGKIDSGGTLTFNQAGATFGNSGQILAGGNVTINARAVNNDGGQLGTGGNSSADLALSSDQLSNQDGRIATGRDLTMMTHSLTAMGELFGGRDLSLSMDGDFVQGSGAQLLHANRDLSLSVTGNITNTATLGASGTLTLSGQQISNQAGATIEGGAVVLNARCNLVNAGEIDATNALNVSAANVGNSGAIVGGNVSVVTGNLDNSGAAALVGATSGLSLGVDGTLNNTGGATLYSSGDIAIGARNGSATGTVNNLSSTIEAGGSLALNASTLNNIRENVHIVQVKTVDETVHMTLPSWYHHGDNHNSYETSAANYYPHEVYFVKPSDILEDQVYITPDGYTIHRAVIQTHANDSAFFVAGTGLYSAYGAQQRLQLTDGTRVMYYTDGGPAANPDQGGATSSVLSLAPWVTHWTSTVSFSNQYGNCSSDCIRLVTQPGYDDPRTIIDRDKIRSLANVKEKAELYRDAHHTAVEDQLAPGAGAVAQILSGGNMFLAVSNAINNQYADIKAQGVLNIGGGTVINNVGATLYRTHNFDGTWTTDDGINVVAYQEPSISEAIGSVAGVIHGEQGVNISGRTFSNVDVTAGTVGNIRDAVNVIGSGAAAAPSAGAHATANASGSATGTTAASASTSSSHAGLAGPVNAIGGSGGALANLVASANGAVNGQHAAAEVRGSGYSNQSVAGDAGAASGATNGLATMGMVDVGAASGPVDLGKAVVASANQTHMDSLLSASGAAAGQQAAAVQGAALGGVVKVAPSGLFLRNPDPNGSYVFETRPQFANQQQWTSSDYLLNQLAHDPALTQKRLGDGFYEQRMVREQLSELAGHAPDAGVSDDSEYKQLLTNAVSEAKAFNLRPGVALSPEQVSRLTNDIVWMVSETVMLPDGSTDTVLVPKVYLAHVGPNAVKPTGALVAGDGVSINVTDSIANQGGVIDGGNGRTLLVAGQDIVNQGGTIKGGAVALSAGNDIKNESLTVKQTYDFGQNSGSNTALSNVATIAATGTLEVMAGRDLSDQAGKISAGSATLSAGRDISFNTLQTGSTYQSQISGYTENDSTVTHQLSQISTGGDLRIEATGNLNLTGTQVAIGTGGTGIGKLLAGGTINIAAVTDEVKTSVMNDPTSRQYDRQVHDNQTVVGAVVNGTGSLVLGAGLTGSGSINISGSAISAGDALAMRAADSVNIISVQENHLSDTASTRTSSSVFKSKTTQQADYVASSDAVASSVSGKTVDIGAGKDINVLGSAVVGDGDVSLAATGSVNIGAATSTLTEQHHTQTKESGFLSGGGFGISYGTRTTTTDQQRDATTQSGQSRSMVGSLGGNLNIVAGDAIKVSGSDLAAGMDMNLAGRSVTIEPGQDNSKGRFEQKTVQDALTLAVGGSMVNAIQTAQSMSSAASQSKDTRVQAIAAATAAMAAKDAAADYAKNGLSVSLSLTVGHSESDQKTSTSEAFHMGSTLTAGRDLTIVAKGDGSGGNGDINVIASDIKAGRDVTLAATNQVNLLAAQDLQSQHSESKSSSAAAGVGISYRTNNGTAIGFTASVSASKGNQDGDGTIQVNTHVNAGRTLAIASGGDTNIKGAIASANQVVADVGGNLNIASLQDTAKFDSKEQSASISGTYGYGFTVSGSLNQSKINSDYASVQEQSGIKAGDGGFQITVAGNTDLKGAVISSTKAGTAANSLVTRTLTHSEIENHATMEASSIGLSGSFTAGGDDSKKDGADGAQQQGGKGKGPGGIDLVDVASEKGGSGGKPSAIALSNNDKSTTNSGISAGAVTVTDGTTQSLAGLDRNVSTGTDISGRLSNNFNAAATQTTLQVAEQFTQTVAAAAAAHAAKLVGDVSSIKESEAHAAAVNYANLATAAANNGDTAAAAAYQIQANDARATEKAWGEDGAFRLALHAGAQGTIGGIAGGSVGAIDSAVGVVGGNLGKQLGEFLANAQTDRLSDAQKQDLVNTYKQTMATIGGTVAGIAVGSGTDAAQTLADAVQAGTTALAVDVNNRQMHWKNYVAADDACVKNPSGSGCATILKMGGVHSQFLSFMATPTANVVVNTDINGKVVSYTLLDKSTNQPLAIMEPMDFDAFRTAPVGIQELTLHNSPQWGLDAASTGLELAAGNTGKALDTAKAAVTSPEFVRDEVIAIVGGIASGGLAGKAGGIVSTLPEVESGNLTSAAQRVGVNGLGGTVETVESVAPNTVSQVYEANSASSRVKTGIVETSSASIIAPNNVATTTQVATRSAADINAEMVAAGNQAAWMPNTQVVHQVVPAGTKYQMVVIEEQAQALMEGKTWFGGWATPNNVPSQAFARNNLSILPEFKPDVSYVVTVETTAPQAINSGVAGPLGSFSGGEAQVQFLGVKNLQLVGQPKPLPINH